MPYKYWNAAFFDSGDVDTTNHMAVMAREQLLACSEITKEEIAMLKMKYPHLTTRD
jgi:hypothetical protein